jgi:hypothetical protein
LHHQVFNKISVDPFGRGFPADDLSVKATKGRRDRSLFTVIAPNLKTVSAPTGVALIDRDRALMFSRVHRPTAVAIKQQVVVFFYAITPFEADVVNSFIDALMAQEASGASILTGDEIFNHASNISKQRRVVRLRQRPSSDRPRGLSACKSRDMAARYPKNSLGSAFTDH